MFPEFTFDPEDSEMPAKASRPESPEEKAQWERYLKTRLKPEERDRLELLLLGRLKQHTTELREMLRVMTDHWTYEDHFYRYYHGSWKVYSVQTTTGRAVKLLRQLLPERELNLSFESIIRDGTGKEFEQNKEWSSQTRPMLEAFGHAKFMVEMAGRYADLEEPPKPMPSGYAALLYLFNLR